MKPQDKDFIEYRIYYNDNGDIIMCCMVSHPSDTNYIVVDKNIYDNYFRYCVKNGKPTLIDRTIRITPRLKKGTGEYTVVKGHASLIIDDESYTEVEQYGNR